MPWLAAVSTLVFALDADTTPVRLAYEAPATCPAESEFFDAIAARTSHVRRASGDESALDVSVRVSRTERGFRGEVRETVNHSESSARTMDGTTCKEVVEALSLTIALSVDPNAHAPVPVPASAEKAPICAPAPAPPCPPPAAPEASAVGASPAAKLEVEMGVDALAFEALSSELDAGAALSATFSRRNAGHAFSALELSLLFAKSGLFSTPSDHTSEFAGLAIDACPLGFRVGSVELGPCLLAVGGVLGATGRNIAQPQTVSRGFWSAGLDFKLSALLAGGFVFEGTLGGAAPLVERRFYETDPARVIAKTPVISPLLRLGLGYRF